MSAPTINVSEFLPLVRLHAYGAPDPTIMQSLRMAAVEFCERTRCWRHVHTLALPETGKARVAPTWAAIHEFETATWSDETDPATATFEHGIELTPLSYSDIGPGGFVHTGGPQAISQVSPNEVIVLPAQAGVLRLSLFLKPMHGQEWDLASDGEVENRYDTVPAFLLSMHGETIAAGALARLLMQAKTAYYSPDRAAMFAARFEAAADTRSVHNLRGQQRAPVRVTSHWL